MVDADAIRQRWEAVGAKLDERGRRLFAAAEARTAGRGGLAMVSKITGLARSTINRGEDDLDTQPLLADTVRKELVKLGFSGQSNRKADEGSHHPDRNAQFEYINAKVVAAQVRQQPVISVDTKKKELIGNFKNGGTDYRPKRKPRRVNVHDFEDKKRGKVVPYGVYDMFANGTTRSPRDSSHYNRCTYWSGCPKRLCQAKRYHPGLWRDIHQREAIGEAVSGEGNEGILCTARDTRCGGAG